MVISANYNDYISFVDYAISAFLRVKSVRYSFLSADSLAWLVSILFEIWFKIYDFKVYRLQFGSSSERNQIREWAREKENVTCKCQLLIYLYLPILFPIIHPFRLVGCWKLWKCGSLIRACIRKCWKVARQEISKWTFHAHYYSHLNGNWSASLCMNEIDESKTTKSNPFRYGSRCTRLNVFICHILCPLPRNQSQKRENVKCLFVRELEIFCLLFIHAKVYFSIGTIGRRQNNPDTTVNYV